MKKLAILLLLPACVITATAQPDYYRMIDPGERDVNIRSQRYGDEITISAEKTRHGKYSVYLEFNKSDTRHNIPDVFKIMLTNHMELARFRIDSTSSAPGFSYNYYPGEVNGRVREDFVYRLPFEEGTKRRVRIFRYDTPDRRSGGNDIMDHVAFVFTASEGDDVYAMRKGTVSKIEDTEWFLEGVADDKVLRKANKQVCVEHMDGTTAYYTGIQEGTVTVKPGDTVYPDTKLGKAGTLDEVSYEIRVSVDYLTCPMAGHVPDFKEVKRNILIPYFMSEGDVARLEDGKEYGCVITDKLVTAEMTKREQRDRNKK